MSSGEIVSGVLIYTVSQVGTQFFDYGKVQAQIAGVNRPASTQWPVIHARAEINRLGARQMWVGCDALICRALIYYYTRAKFFESFMESSKSKDKRLGERTDQEAICGAMAAGLAGLISSPLDLILLRKQVDHSFEQPRKYGNVFKALTQVGGKGFKELWIGSSANSLKCGSLVWAMLNAYGSSIGYFSKKWGDTYVTAIATLGVSSVFGSIASLPFDNIKTKLQWQQAEEYKGFLDCWRKSKAREGVRGFYTGFWLYTARNFISGIGVVLLIDLSRRNC